MMLVLATVRYESVTLASRVRQLVAVPGKISYGELPYLSGFKRACGLRRFLVFQSI